MKILISHSSVYNKEGWGRIFPFAEELVKLGNKVTIITSNPNYSIFVKKLILNNVNIIVFPEIMPQRVTKLGFGLLSMILKIFYVLINEFDIVHSDNGHRPLSGVPCRISKKLFNSIYIAEWYDWYGKGGQYDSKRKLFKFFLGRYELKYEIKDKLIADGIVVLSDVMLERASSLFPNKQIIKIHGGADVSAIKYIYDNSSIKEKHGINKNMLTFGYIDALSNNFKEIQPLVKSILELNIDSEIKILLFGRKSSLDTNMPIRIKNLLINFGWINYSTDYEKLQCVDVFFTFKEDILGNRAGWPNCLGDYLACGRPVFLNPVGEVIKFVEKYPTGFIISSLSDNSIKQNLITIMNKKSLLLQMGEINRKIAENEVSWKIKSRLLYDFYKNVIDYKNNNDKAI